MRPSGIAIKCNQVFVLTAGLLVCGCSGDRLPTYPTTVKVSLPDGQPVPGARVALRATAKGISAKGIADAAGIARITTYEKDDGAIAGSHAAAIGPPTIKGDPDESRQKLPFAKRFAQFHTSQLEFVVKEEADANNFEVVLTPR